MAGVDIAVGAADWPPVGWSLPLWAHASGEATDNIVLTMAAAEIIPPLESE